MDKETVSREDRELLLATVQVTQAAFWDALGELEEATGLDLDSTQDFRDRDLSDLRQEGEC